MPEALLNNASPPRMLQDKSREIDGPRKKDIAICPTDDDSIAPQTKKPQTQSFDYIWRTGLAGGLAGSSVYTHFASVPTQLLTNDKGQNSSCALGSSQNPLSSP